MTRQVVALHSPQQDSRSAAQIRRWAIVLAIIAAIAALLIAASLVWRDATHMHNPNERASQWITTGITVAAGSLLVFFWGMKLSPRLAYRRFLRDLREGLSRYEEGVVTRIDADRSVRDGVAFRAFVLNVGDPANPEDERLLYWDEQLGEPCFQEGDRLTVHIHGNDLIGIRREGDPS